MKRDMELVRTILMVVERDATATGWVRFEPEDTPGYEHEDVVGHIRLLRDAGYLDAIDASTMAGPKFYPQRLTWAGHELLDAVRNDTIWTKTKRVIADKGGAIPFELLKELAVRIARQQFELLD